MYKCLGCKKAGKFTGVTVVNETEFVRDPCGFSHACVPTKWSSEISQRTFYEKCQQWRSNANFVTHDPYKEYGSIMYETESRIG